MTTAGEDRDYVLGTHDEELARLALQHRVWRLHALDAWRRAGFTVGQTLLDVGCGPGYATVDLAEIVGPTGRVIAMDRSRRFLDTLEATRRQRGLQHVEPLEIDLDEADLPHVGADGAWCRWIFSFVKRPRDLLGRIGKSLRRGGLDLPLWLDEAGFAINTMGPIIHVVAASSLVWQWPKSFVQVNLRRLVELAYLTPNRAAEIADEFGRREAAPHTLMITPAVLEIVAQRR